MDRKMTSQSADSPPTLLVTVDSLRYDHYQYMEATRSFLGESHPATFATNTATPSCFQSIIGGEYPGEVGVSHEQSVIPQLPATYKTGISTNRFLSERYGYHHGLDQWSQPDPSSEGSVNRLKKLIAANTTPQSPIYGALSRAYNTFQAVVSPVRGNTGRDYRSAESVIAELLDSINSHDDWFGWVHLMEPHHPYNPAEGPVPRDEAQRITRRLLSGRGSTEDAEIGRALYRGEVEELDKHLAALWDAIPVDTRVVFVADHGELLGEYGEWGHHATMCPEILRLPFATRNIEVSSSVVSLVDVPSYLLGREHGDGQFTREVAYAASNGNHAAMNTTHVATADGVRTLTGEESTDTELELLMKEWAASASEPVAKDELPEDDLEALGYL